MTTFRPKQSPSRFISRDTELFAPVYFDKTITKNELLKYQHTDSNCLSISPIFGINTIKCDDDFYEASSYKTGDGKENNYSVRYNNGNFDFYNITDRRTMDTVQTKTYLLTDLKKERLVNVCKNDDRQK